MNDEELAALALALFPHLKAQLAEEMRGEHVHQYVITGGPRRVIERFEDVVIYVFFCENCLDVKTKIKHIPRHGDPYWTTC